LPRPTLLPYTTLFRSSELDAAVDCWGGAVTRGERWPTNEHHPVTPIDLTPQIRCPLLGIFGNDDQFPTPQEVDETEAALKAAGKDRKSTRLNSSHVSI